MLTKSRVPKWTISSCLRPRVSLQASSTPTAGDVGSALRRASGKAGLARARVALRGSRLPPKAEIPAQRDTAAVGADGA
jgi:hypothetical protein